jgi:hypothetical protein
MIIRKYNPKLDEDQLMNLLEEQGAEWSCCWGQKKQGKI